MSPSPTLFCQKEKPQLVEQSGLREVGVFVQPFLLGQNEKGQREVGV
jgi:hypothetical protein